MHHLFNDKMPLIFHTFVLVVVNTARRFIYIYAKGYLHIKKVRLIAYTSKILSVLIMDFYNVSLLNMIFEAEKKLAIRLTELLCTVSTVHVE